MSKRTWACFVCRKTTRREAAVTAPVTCPDCGRAADYVGYKIPIPPRRDVAAWRALEQQLAQEAISRTERDLMARVQEQHEIERQIAEVASRPETAGRRSLLRSLQRRLSQLLAT